MTKEYQVTLMCETNEYKPVSCIIKREQYSDVDFTKNATMKTEIINEGVKKICLKRGWDKTYLNRYHYRKARVRAYDRAKIERENKERYERIKEEKYATGEWQRPKEKA